MCQNLQDEKPQFRKLRAIQQESPILRRTFTERHSSEEDSVIIMWQRQDLSRHEGYFDVPITRALPSKRGYYVTEADTTNSLRFVGI